MAAKDRHADLVGSFLAFYERAKAELKTVAVSICDSINERVVDDELVQLYLSATKSFNDMCSTLTTLNTELATFLSGSPYLHAEHVPTDLVIEIALEFDYAEIRTHEDIMCALVTVKRAFEYCVNAEYNMRKTNSLDVCTQLKLASYLSDSGACVVSLLGAAMWSNDDKFMLDDME
jgi:hypothetical protein